MTSGMVPDPIARGGGARQPPRSAAIIRAAIIWTAIVRAAIIRAAIIWAAIVRAAIVRAAIIWAAAIRAAIIRAVAGSPTIAPVREVPDAAVPPLRGVITDWGGVFTSPIADTVDAWLTADLIDREHYLSIMRAWVRQAYDGSATVNPIHQLERGETDPADFERELAGRLIRTDGARVQPAGLLERMFAATMSVPAMYDLMRTLRRAGVRTCLLSNSWGHNDYPRHHFPELFDAWVISGEVGMRKPEARIFRHAAGLLGLPPQQCVFIDDIEANVTAATAVGMVGVLHDQPAATAARVAGLLGLPPARQDPPITRSDPPITRSDAPITRSDAPITRSDAPITRSDPPPPGLSND
ncbi:MAG TPA: HAD family phosphatase [Streptosporangiaceae bacterium]|nr:HAD family phosphatase [Streptosporangiaceae bacterium]